MVYSNALSLWRYTPGIWNTEWYLSLDAFRSQPAHAGRYEW